MALRRLPLGLLPFLTFVLLHFVPSGEAAIDMGYPKNCFFTVAQSSSGTWWFVDPNGDPFLSLGVTTVSYWGDTSTTGAKPYYMAVSAKFNNQSLWADLAVDRLHSWNMNTLGAWADNVVVTKGLPYTCILGFVGGFGSWLAGLFPDVFDPAWQAFTLKQAKALCEPVRNDLNLIGYFLDNEVFWGPMMGGWPDWRYNGSILDQMLTEYNATAPGRIQAIAFLKTKYSNDINALNTAWKTSYSSFDLISVQPPASSAHTNDSSEWAYIAAKQFFSVAESSIRTYDKHHLIMGIKFAGALSTPVLKACAEHNNMISIDYYPSVSKPLPNPNFITQVYSYTKKPILIGEFAYRGNDTGLPNTKGAGLVVANQALRAEGYKNYTTILAKLPYVIGLHWFEWFDEPAEGRQLDGENSNYGVVDSNDDTYVTLTNMMKTVNPQLYTLHESSPSGLSSAQCFSKLDCLNSCSGHGCCNYDSGTCSCDSGFSSADCSVDSSQLTVNSFGSSLNTTTWSALDDTMWGRMYYKASQTSTVSNQLKLAISPCSASCSGYPYEAAGVRTTSSDYGYGIYTAVIKAPLYRNFSAQMELHSGTSPRESITLRIEGNQTVASYSYFMNDAYAYLNWGHLPPSIPNTNAFHTYSIHYFETYFAFYAEGTLLAYFNSSNVPLGLPSKPMALWFYVTVDDYPTTISDAMFIKSVSYELVDKEKAVCADGGSASGLVTTSFSTVFALLLLFLLMN